MFSYFQSFANSLLSNKLQSFDEYNVKIDINNENIKVSNNNNNKLLEENFEDVESGNTSIKTLFTDSEWTQVSKILLNYKTDYKILTQIFGEVRRRQQTFNQETI